MSTNLTCIENGTSSCSCFEFIIPETLTSEDFASVEVWFHKQNLTRSLRINLIIPDSSSLFEFIKPIKTIGNWRKYALPNNRFIPDFTKRNVLTIEATIDENEADMKTQFGEIGDEKPFLIIRQNAIREPNRRKRSITCTDSSFSCCKENFFLNFTKIGWENWILHPDGYQANFCRGRCSHDLSNTRFYHGAVLLSYIRDNSGVAEEIGLDLCCTPSVMAPVSIIYRNEDGIIYHKTIDNMKVESCDCA